MKRGACGSPAMHGSFAWDLFRTYRSAIAPALLEVRRLTPLLETIRQFAGPEPRLLPAARTTTGHGPTTGDRRGDPADRIAGAHELFAAAWQMARRAASGRRNAVSSGDMTLAWEASSAAAGALMLLRARGPGTRSTDRTTSKPVITPRITRLLRVADLQAMHAYLAQCAACAGGARAAW